MSVYRLKSENELDVVDWRRRAAIRERAAVLAQEAKTESKYHNVATDGEASKKQAKRLRELRILAEAGLIRGLARQPEYVLIPNQTRECGELIERKMTYIADFIYEEATPDGWRIVVEDAKGFATPGYIQKRKLMLRIHGIEIRET